MMRAGMRQQEQGLAMVEKAANEANISQLGYILNSVTKRKGPLGGVMAAAAAGSKAAAEVMVQEEPEPEPEPQASTSTSSDSGTGAPVSIIPSTNIKVEVMEQDLKPVSVRVQSGRYHYKCPLCNNMAKSKSGGIAHLREMHTGETVVCPRCGWSTYSDDSMLRHTKKCLM